MLRLDCAAAKQWTAFLVIVVVSVACSWLLSYVVLDSRVHQRRFEILRTRFEMDLMVFMFFWAIFLTCVTRRRGVRGSEEAGRANALNEPLTSDAEKDAEKEPASRDNYLNFLKMGMHIFSILLAITCTSGWLYPTWEWASLLGVTAMKTTWGYSYNATCVPGLPSPLHYISDSACELDLTGGRLSNVADLPACLRSAVRCAAPMASYNAERSECALLNNSSIETSFSTSNHSWTCVGKFDTMDGKIQIIMTVVHGFVVLAFAGRWCYNAKVWEDEDAEERNIVWFTNIPIKDSEDGEYFLFDNGEPEQQVAKLLHQNIESKYREVGIVYVRYDCEEKSRLTGHAFAVYHDSPRRTRSWNSHCVDKALRALWFLRRPHKLVKFGTPPFSTVTLHCRKAPPNKDIIHHQLHQKKSHVVLGLGAQLVLGIVVLNLIPPKNLIEPMHVWIHQEDRDWTVFRNLQAFIDSLPSYYLTLVNYYLLPEALSLLMWMVRRPDLHSQAHGCKCRWNLRFLIIFSLIGPMLEQRQTYSVGQSASGLLSNLDTSKGFSSLVLQVMVRFGYRAENARGIQALSYMMDAALVTGATQLVQLGGWFGWILCRCPNANAPEFDWGYWYAWAISILVLALATSIAIPGMLPYAFLFFAIKYNVDKVNFERGVFMQPRKMSKRLEATIASSLMQAVSLFWFLMAIFFRVQNPPEDTKIRFPAMFWACDGQPDALHKLWETFISLPLGDFCVSGEALAFCISALLFTMLSAAWYMDIRLAQKVLELLFQASDKICKCNPSPFVAQWFEWLFRGGFSLLLLWQCWLKGPRIYWLEIQLESAYSNSLLFLAALCQLLSYVLKYVAHVAIGRGVSRSGAGSGCRDLEKWFAAGMDGGENGNGKYTIYIVTYKSSSVSNPRRTRSAMM